MDCIKNLKAELNSTTSQLQQAREQLASQQQQLLDTSRQLEAAVQQQQQASSSLSQQLVQAVQQEKDRGTQALAELQERWEWLSLYSDLMSSTAVGIDPDPFGFERIGSVFAVYLQLRIIK